MLESELNLDDALSNMNGNIAREVKRERNLELLEKLTHKNRGRGFWRCFGYEELQQAREVLQGVIEESEGEYLERLKRKEAIKTIREEIEAQLKERGFSSADVFGADEIERPMKVNKTASTRKERIPAMVRYKVNVFGKDFFWSGCGITPKAFRYSYRVNGTQKKDYLIDEPLENTTALRCKKIPAEYVEECERVLNNG